MTFDPLQLKTQYRLRFEKVDSYRQKLWSVLCRDFFSRFIPPSSRLLELGAGWGEFINQIDAAERHAMDLNPELPARLAPEVVPVVQDCSKPWPFPENRFDAIFTSNFLEHLPDRSAIGRTVSEAFRCLRPGGTMICMGPNIRYTGHAYWDFWDHVVPLTDRSCAELLAIHGFTIERTFPKFLPYSMSNGFTPPLFMVRLYLRIPPFWTLLGKQFLIIARKGEVP